MNVGHIPNMMFSAGLFWASEGAVALGYPEPAKRGKYMKFVQCPSYIGTMANENSIWLWFRTGGPLVGGAIVLGLNQFVQLISHVMCFLLTVFSSSNQKAKGKVGYGE